MSEIDLNTILDQTASKVPEPLRQQFADNLSKQIASAVQNAARQTLQQAESADQVALRQEYEVRLKRITPGDFWGVSELKREFKNRGLVVF